MLKYISSYFVIATIFVACSTGVKSTKTVIVEDAPSYELDIKPLLVRSCTPCHFPENGRKKMLDTYEAVANNINDIIYRVKLPEDEIKYMPFKSKREALTALEINLLEDWVKKGKAK